MSRHELGSLSEEVEMAIGRGRSGLSHKARNRWITSYSVVHKKTLNDAAQKLDRDVAQLLKAISLSKTT